jgi:hypothetical protein
MRELPPDPGRPRDAERSDFLDALKKGALLGGLLLLLIVPLRMMNRDDAPKPPEQVAAAPQAPAQPQPLEGMAPPAHPGLQLADFAGEEPSADARLVANWAVATRNHKNRAFVIVDKKDARVYVFGADGRLRDSAPALLGAARGDDSAPGIGDKPLSEVKPEEKTRPAASSRNPGSMPATRTWSGWTTPPRSRCTASARCRPTSAASSGWRRA